MKVPDDMAQKMVRIELPRCLLILTGEEYARAILRGKLERRREAAANRLEAREPGNILRAFEGEDGQS